MRSPCSPPSHEPQADSATPLPSSAPLPAPKREGTAPIDPALVQERRPLANRGDGIENMGLVRSDVFDRAVGGGLVAWYMRMRNKTGVARIVAYRWTDMNRQEQRGSIQIQGGEVANPRLDLTQARPIASVRNLRVTR